MAFDERTRITSGPSKFDLMLSLFDRKPVKFTVDKKEIEVRINRIEAEDSSCESWNLVGYIICQLTSRPEPHFSAYFSTKTRSGVFHRAS